MATTEQISAWLTHWVSTISGTPVHEIGAEARFSDYGLDSPQIVRMMAELSQVAGRHLSTTLVFRYPSIKRLAAAALNENPNAGSPTPPSVEVTHHDPSDDPIAIIGMSCRFPGANDPQAFWRLLSGGVDAVRAVPGERWSTDSLYDSDPTAAGKTVAREGGFLESVDGFDPLFFGISPREAQEMDPQQRMVLELAWEALDDAGARPASLRGTRTGVFFGVIWQDYNLRCALDLPAITQHSATGRAGNIVANRVSYALGLRGPSMVVDTACSASLVAVHLACQSMWSGESSMAVAGGINLMLAPDTMVALSKFGGLSPDSRSFAFDARANGFARGEGCGVIVLKRLSRAIADGDEVYCVIRGSAVNNNGESSGLTAPSPWAQEEVLRDAWARAGRLPQQAHYVESHGTGTALGDPIEASALGAVFSANRPDERPLRIGSVKTNIGHLEGAAGIAGLIKTALAIKHRALPPSLHFQTPNPEIAFDQLRLQVQTTLEPWPHNDELALAGVSAFGWGGTNAHVVLEEVGRHPARLMLLAAESPETLRMAARELAIAIAEESTGKALAEVSLQTCGDGPYRASIVARSTADLIQQLRAMGEGNARPDCIQGVAKARCRVAFVCTPQGSAWWGMGRELLATEPVFRAEIEALDLALRKLSPISILGELAAPEGRSRLDDVTVVQPLLFAVQSALVALLRSWGLEPDVVIGHSLGELVAAYVTGALDIDDAATLIHHHSRLYGHTSGQAGMAVIGMAEPVLADVLHRYGGRITIAANNSPVATVVSGEPAALDELLREIGAQGIPCSRINVNIGGHCQALDPVLDEYRHELRVLTPRTTTIPMMSTVTVERIEGSALDAAYWVRNMREPVRFSQAIEVLLAEGYDIFVEISPTPVLTHSIQQTIALRGKPAAAFGTTRRGDERASLLATMGALHVRGIPLQLDRISGSKSLRPRISHHELLALSAHSLPALRETARSIATLANTHPELSRSDLCYATGARRSHHEHRLAIVAPSTTTLANEARLFADVGSSEGGVYGHAPSRQRGIVFVMAGQGSQWAGMGSELLSSEPIFRRAIERCDEAIARHTNWSLLQELAHDRDHSRLDRTEIAQPALFALEVALAALWSSWGIQPAAVIGHSVGEVAAAYLAGALSFEDAVRVVCLRGKSMSGTFGRGRMAAVDLNEQQALQLVSEAGGGIDLAAINSPNSVVLSGDPEQLQTVLDLLQKRGVASRLLDVQYAFHSQQMTRCAEDLVAALNGLSPAAGVLPVLSTTDPVDSLETRFDAAYWGRNVDEPVRFAAAVDQAVAQGYELFLEIGPHPVLARSLAECLEHSGRRGVAIGSLRRNGDERKTMLEALGTLYINGVDVAFHGLHPAPGRPIKLPAYSWQHTRFPLQPQRSQIVTAPDRTEATIDPTTSGHVEKGQLFYALTWQGAALTQPSINATSHPGTWLILSDSGGLGDALAEYLARAGQHCELVSATHGLPARHNAEYRSVIYLGSLTEQAPEEQTRRALCDAVVLVQHLGRSEQATPPTLCLVTRDCYAAQPNAYTVAQSSLWGMGQVVQYEHPELRCKLIDLSMPTVADNAQALAHELLSGDPEDSIALRPEGRFVARLMPKSIVAPTTTDRYVPRTDEPFRLEIPSLGEIDRLTLRATETHDPQAGEIVIEVHAAGMNFLDVLFALDDYPDEVPHGPRSLGQECAGIVVAVGEGVKNFTIGQPVVALAPWSFASRVVTQAVLATAMPASLTMEDAATLPIAFLTACYALEQVGRLRRGERVLIHTATGGVGLAAIQIALNAGAEVYATAGSPEKREWLRSMGIALVMDSRSLTFADEVRTHTGGEGIDLILNTLTGEAIPKGLSLLRAGGRFCDISKRDIHHRTDLDLGLFRKGISYTSINLSSIIADRPDTAGAMLREVIDRVSAGTLQPLSYEVFPISRASAAFEHMARGEHRGKIVLHMQDPEATIEASSSFVKKDATYLISGGLGGLGLAMAAWLVESGARHLMLLGRSQPSAVAEQMLAKMRHAGANISVVPVDVRDRTQLADALASVEGSRPLRGILHAAATLDDGVLMQMTPERLLSPMGPKADGAWNLHELTEGLPLDFFVLFSSAVALVGAPGQANYAAANAFLDALARLRRSRGLPAISVQWGPWAEIGMAAKRADRGDRLAEQGMPSLKPQEALDALGTLLRAGANSPANIGVLRFDAKLWCESHSLSTARFANLRDPRQPLPAVAASETRTRLASEASPAKRRELLDLYLRDQAARVLRLEPSQIDLRQSLQRLGLDSLMSLELRRRIEVGLGLVLPGTLMWDYPTIAALCPFLLNRMGMPLETPKAEPESLTANDAAAEQLIALLAALPQLAHEDQGHPGKVVSL